METSSGNQVPKPQGSEVSDLVTIHQGATGPLTPGAPLQAKPTRRLGEWGQQPHNLERNQSGTAREAVLREPSTTRPLRRPSTVAFPVLHLGAALWTGSGCSPEKRPRKTGRWGRLNTLLQGASQPWRGDTASPAWPGGQTALCVAKAHRFHSLSRSSSSKSDQCFQGRSDDRRDSPTRVCRLGGSGAEGP